MTGFYIILIKIASPLLNSRIYCVNKVLFSFRHCEESNCNYLLTVDVKTKRNADGNFLRVYRIVYCVRKGNREWASTLNCDTFNL